ncbi:hypothetical protein [Streptomyces sp. NPDC086989]|uniref:hypothetical protein n=1 Tax=Streptomyces sp. NPDC086989 TaxID=3365764 RepID=UPI00380E9FBF
MSERGQNPETITDSYGRVWTRWNRTTTDGEPRYTTPDKASAATADEVRKLGKGWDVRH